MSSQLAPRNEPVREFAGGIRFAITDGCSRVVCWASREALKCAVGTNSSREESAVLFERQRLQIERLAREKYVGGEHSPIVMSFDVIV